MINNKDSSNNNTFEMFLLVYFQWLCLLELFVFACLLILGDLKVKNYLKINMLIIKMFHI